MKQATGRVRTARVPRTITRAAFDPFLVLLKAHGLPAPQTEYPFAAAQGRRWLADYAWLSWPLILHGSADGRNGVIVEKNGGIWRKGGHSSGRGLLRDYEKANAAQLQGFLYLQWTPQQLMLQSTLDTLKRLLLA